MLSFFKKFKKKNIVESTTNFEKGGYPHIIKKVEDKDIRNDVINKVLSDMPIDVRKIFASLSKDGVEYCPAFEEGCSFTNSEVNVVITSHSVHLDFQGSTIYYKWYVDDISLFSTYLTTKTLKEMWEETINEVDDSKEREENIQKAIEALKARKRKKNV